MDFFDIHQEGRINRANADADRANSKARENTTELQLLQRQVDHLTLLSQSMWELLSEHSGLSDQLLRAKIAEIDTRDGKADGKIGASVFPCPKCAANCHSTSQRCTMCGVDLRGHKAHLFEG